MCAKFVRPLQKRKWFENVPFVFNMFVNNAATFSVEDFFVTKVAPITSFLEPETKRIIDVSAAPAQASSS